MKRLLRLSVLALALTALACGGESDPAGTPIDTTTDGGTNTPQCAAESNRHTNVAPATLPTDSKRLIVFGDSISAGVGAPTGQAYFDLLTSAKASTDTSANLATLYGHDVPVVNVAVGGATTANLAGQVTNLKTRLPAPVAGHSIIVVTIGGNDLMRFTGIATIEQKLRAFITSLQDPAWFPDGTTILLANVYDPSDGVGSAPQCFNGFDASSLTGQLPTWGEHYATLAKELGVGIVDSLGHFRGHGFHYDDTSNQYYQSTDATLWFANDCIHPNERGHSELRRLFYEALDCKFLATP